MAKIPVLLVSCASLLLAGCGAPATVAMQAPGLAPSASPTGYDVAWVDRPAPPYPDTTAPAAPAPPTVAPACRADQVSGKYEFDGAAAGSLLFSILFTNTSTQPCLLRGTPRVVATQPGLPDRTATPADHPPLGGAPGDMAPGATTVLSFQEGVNCDTTPPPVDAFYHRLTVTLPTGGIVVVPVADDADNRPGLTCVFQAGRFHVQVPQPEPSAPPWTNLTPTLTLPESSKAGSTLNYLVTLTNPTDNAIGLQPCPGYIQAAYSTDTNTVVLDPSAPPNKQQTHRTPVSAVKQTYGLNCSTVTSIPAHGSVRYAMQLAVPADMPPGTMTVHWGLLGPGPGLTGGTVQIR